MTPSPTPLGTHGASATATPTSPTTPTASPAGSPSATAAGPLRPGEIAVRLVRIAVGVQEPLFLTHAGDGSGRRLVVERDGWVRTLLLEGDLLDEPYLDISDRISSGGERGLLGLAFHPRFSENGRLFVDYADAQGDTVVSEFTVAEPASGRPDPGGERIILRIPQPAANHNGGWIGFGPEGMLHVATGDGGGGNSRNGRRLDTLLGKVLRIDVDGARPYAMPPDNPFIGRQGVRPEILHAGLRNPWRMSFDRQTGDLWMGDVGATTFEEIDLAPAGSRGLDFGWDIMEGDDCRQAGPCPPEGVTGPVLAYGRSEGSIVTGGYVYHGPEWPALRGVYLFGDAANGRIWGFRAADGRDGSAEKVLLLESGRYLVSFGEDEVGEVYVMDFEGAVYRVEGRPGG
ncbi:MAG TPA: PQQ-dependent sugar dehydrogenase [Candidatus Limnocylindrales bacterium]|nr:PQQ-dependent sugar dehydrogenase [Candidatus Limnocylindrales bacterium]